jgi:phosphate transport system substrate-binding protein
VHLYARNRESGTWETFDQIVLHANREPLSLSPSAERIEDSAELSDKVSRDPYGIGFIGLPYIRASKGLLISAVNHAYFPTLYTVRTETYPLSRRLYMYAPRASANPEIARFLQFVGSTAGQKVVEQIGFVSLDVTPPAATELSAIVADLPTLYQHLFAQIGPHVPFETTIHFRTDSAVIDSRGKDDLARILAYIASNKLSPQDLVLIGHADGTGPHGLNCTLSQNRAKAIAEELAPFGLRAKTVTGFCESVPVAPNETEDGREKNRRVEIWRAKA